MNDTTDQQWRTHIVGLLTMCLCVLLFAELVARFVVPRVSRIEFGIEQERRAANRLGADDQAGRTLLIVGNSLLKAGVNVPQLQQALRPDWSVQRYMIEQTDYLDWYFGLQNLFQNGDRPAVVALMLNVRQLLANSVRGSYSAYRLLSAGGTVRAGIRAGYHPTEISGMLVGHFSAYYGLRTELRKFAFQKLVPGAIPLTEMLVREAPPTRISPTRLDAEGRQRLQELNSLCIQYNVRCVFIVPPSQMNSPARSQLVQLTETLGLSGSRLNVGFGPEPLAAGVAWDDKYFEPDHFHISPLGASAYTVQLAQALKEVLH